MKRLRAGAYAQGDYLVRYLAWLNEDWDGTRAAYRPWHVFRRASHITSRILLERFFNLEDAKQFVSEQIRADHSYKQPA